MSSISGCSNSRVYHSQILRAQDSIRADRTDNPRGVKDDRKSDGKADKHAAKSVDSVINDSLAKSKHGDTAQFTVKYVSAVDLIHEAVTSTYRAVESTEKSTPIKEGSGTAKKTDSGAAMKSDSNTAAKSDSSTATRTDSSTATRTDSSTATRTDSGSATNTDNSTQPESNDTVKDLLNAFKKQFSDLKAQHEAETNAVLEKFNEVTEQLRTLSDQSAEQVKALTDQLGGLGGQLGSVINKLDLLGKGQDLSLRSIGLFNLGAKAGNGALDKLIGIIGLNSTGNQLRDVQLRLQSAAARFASEQVSDGLNLLA